MTVRRCTCAGMIFDNEWHTCHLNTALKPKYYRTETLASTPNSWRLRLRAVLTPNSGLLVFKITKTLPIENGHILIPPEFRLNTIALFGMKPTDRNFYAEVRVHANKMASYQQQILMVIPHTLV